MNTSVIPSRRITKKETWSDETRLIGAALASMPPKPRPNRHGRRPNQSSVCLQPFSKLVDLRTE